jgi:hypothetical protein
VNIAGVEVDDTVVVIGAGGVGMNAGRLDPDDASARPPGERIRPASWPYLLKVDLLDDTGSRFVTSSTLIDRRG